jgi:hypothetical protein
MGRGHRNMYYATGQPGWMRLGYSPGWVGQSRSGLGPCAEYLLRGQWPVGAASFREFPGQGASSGELEMLKTQADRLEQTLSQLRERIVQLESPEEK